MAYANLCRVLSAEEIVGLEEHPVRESSELVSGPLGLHLETARAQHVINEII